jgi:hypothetical protein
MCLFFIPNPTNADRQQGSNLFCENPENPGHVNEHAVQDFQFKASIALGME